MHKDVLHILNNNHIFGITDGGGGIHIKTFVKHCTPQSLVRLTTAQEAKHTKLLFNPI